MTKFEFLLALRDRLEGLPQKDMEERLRFYAEMIEDRMEEGLSEEEAVAEMGAVGEIAGQIIADIPLTKLVKEKIKTKRRLGAWEIVLLVLGFPVWLPLLISFFAVVLSLYIALWAVLVSLWAVFLSVAVCALCGTVGGAVVVLCGRDAVGAAVIGTGLVCAGLAVLLFFGCKAASQGTLRLTAKLVLATKNAFVKKEGAV